MRDQTDCHYPHTRLCLNDCEDGCSMRKTVWRKREIEDQIAEDEAFSRIPSTTLDCPHMRMCCDFPSHCPDCPSNKA